MCLSDGSVVKIGGDVGKYEVDVGKKRVHVGKMVPHVGIATTLAQKTPKGSFPIRKGAFIL